MNEFGIVLFFFLLVSGPVESDPEYRLIVAANNLTVEIDNELSELVVPACFLFVFVFFKNNSKFKGFNVVLLCITEFSCVFVPGFQILFTSLLGTSTPRGSQSLSLWCQIL